MPGKRRSRGSGDDVNVAVGRQFVVSIVSVGNVADLELLEVVQAGCGEGVRFGPEKRRQKQRRQERDDSYDDEQLDEGEPVPARSLRLRLAALWFIGAHHSACCPSAVTPQCSAILAGVPQESRKSPSQAHKGALPILVTGRGKGFVK